MILIIIAGIVIYCNIVLAIYTYIFGKGLNTHNFCVREHQWQALQDIGR
jgi:hypothetical protein